MSDSWRRNTFWRWLLSNWQHSMGLRLVLSAALCWWLLAPGSALLALIFRQFSHPSEAVVMAGFWAPMLLLLWWFASFFARTLQAFVVYLLTGAALVQAAGWYWL